MFPMFLNTLSPKFYVALTGTSSVISGLILIFEYWYFKKYGKSFIEQLSLAQIFPLIGLGDDNDIDCDSIVDSVCHQPSSSGPNNNPGGGGGSASHECKISRNPYSLFRGAEYQRYARATGNDPLTYYDMNLSAQHHQTFFTCDADTGRSEYEFMQLAWRERNHEERIRKTREALNKNPECATAMILLAEEDCSTIVECEKMYKQALKCAESSLRRSQQQQQQQHHQQGHHSIAHNNHQQSHQQNALLDCQYRRDLHVCVFIRRRLAMCARKLGKLKEAIKMMKDLIKDHPNFNLFSIHENLIECYLASQQYADAQAFLSKYDDCRYPKSATIWYTAALLKARQVADKFSPDVAARRGLNASEHSAVDAIHRAVEFNPHVPKYLLEMKPLILPTEHILKRGDSEAISYAFFHLAHWKAVDGALNLLCCTWEGTFRLIPNPLERGNSFYPYPQATAVTDRDLLPDFHAISVYPKKEFSLLLLFVIILFILLGLAASLTYSFPDYAGSFTRTVLSYFYFPINYCLEKMEPLLHLISPARDI